ncbi:hypothetical protein ACS8BW_09725, partial [Enterococcus italicus]
SLLCPLCLFSQFYTKIDFLENFATEPSTRMLDRVRQHFLGKGNPDVYAVFRYGTNFSIQFVPLSKSSSITLNELDHEAILAYNGFTRGYNRNKGMQK